MLSVRVLELYAFRLGNLLASRNLKKTAFTRIESLNLTSPLEDHVKWAFENIYSVPYPGQELTETKSIARLIHGIQHVTRAAMYVPVIANLYRRHSE